MYVPVDLFREGAGAARARGTRSRAIVARDVMAHLRRGTKFTSLHVRACCSVLVRTR